MGVGGAGGNAANLMIASKDLEAVEFIAANTDPQALRNSTAENKIQLGAKITKGLGAGSNPEVGRRAAEEDIDTIAEQISGSEIIFLTAGLGGGTGSGALPVIAKAAREKGILSVAIVSTPFLFEGKRRMAQAEAAMENLSQVVDTMIVVPNQKLLTIVDPKISMLDAFAMANEILKQAVKGISDIITKTGHINVDFADVYSIMKDMGRAIMGTGAASGENRAKEAAEKAINSPLLDGVSIEGAKGVLLNITGNSDLGLHEINEAASVIHNLVSEDAEIILGSVIDDTIGDEIVVTVIATGLNSDRHQDLPARQNTLSAAEQIEYSAPEGRAGSRQSVDRSPAQVRGVSGLASPFIKDFGSSQVPSSVANTRSVKTVSVSEDSAEDKSVVTGTNKTVSPRSEEIAEEFLDTEDSDFDVEDIDTPTFIRRGGKPIVDDHSKSE